MGVCVSEGRRKGERGRENTADSPPFRPWLLTHSRKGSENMLTLMCRW